MENVFSKLGELTGTLKNMQIPGLSL